MTTAVSVVSGSKYGFEFLRRVRDVGREPFAKTAGALGCYPRSLAHLVKLCRSAGLVQEPIRNLYGYELTRKGWEALRIWEEFVALDGEPGHGLPDDPFELLGAPPVQPEQSRAYARATASKLVVGERIVDTSEFAKNEEGEW